MIEIGDYITCYNETQGEVIDINKSTCEITVILQGKTTTLHIVNVRTINGVIIYPEDLRI